MAGLLKVTRFALLFSVCSLVFCDGGGTGRPRSGKPGPMWVSPERLALLPMAGRAWAAVKKAADGDLGQPNLAGYTSNHDVKTLAVGLVYARTGDDLYRHKAAAAIMSAIGTEHTGLQEGRGSQQGALAVTTGRNLASYVIAANLIRMEDYDPEMDRTFRTWIGSLRHEQWSDNSLIFNDERRANNHGHMAGASRAAIAVYLGDMDDLRRTVRVFKGFLGDRESYTGFLFKRDTSWQADPFAPVGINPAGAMLNGFSVDGAQPEEMRRGCPFRIPPCRTQYPWEGLQGIMVEAVILANQGYDVWNWSDQAILRAVKFLEQLDTRYPDDGWWAAGDDNWVPWVVNFVYGTDFPTAKARPGKNMGWTDWTHSSPRENQP